MAIHYKNKREIRAAIRRQGNSRANCAKSKGFPFQLKRASFSWRRGLPNDPQAIVISVPPD
jgi:hypothetical protein